MKLPHWLCHDWDKYEAPVTKTCDWYKNKNYSHTERTTYQRKICKTCGLVKEVITKVETFNKFIKEERNVN